MAAFMNPLIDRLQYILRFGKSVMVCHSEYFDTKFAKISAPHLVVLQAGSFEVLRSIHLDAQICFLAIEVKDIRTDGRLPPDLWTKLIVSYVPPQRSFCIGHSSPKFAGPGNSFGVVFFKMPVH